MSLNLHRKKLSVAIILVTLALCALFLAQGTTSMIAAAVLPTDAAGPIAKGGTAEKAPGADPPDIKKILQRNIFDPQTGPLWPPKVAELPDDGSGAEPTDVQLLEPGELPPACDGPTKLIASVYSPGRPEWSFASLGESSGDALLYREGGSVGERRVNSIFPSAVYLAEASGKLCSLTMFVKEEPAKGKTAKKTAKKDTKKTPAKPVGAAAKKAVGGISTDELEQNITKVSDTKFTVQRSLVDKVLENQAEIMRSARVVPHEQNGQVVGVKLYGIRRNSLLGKLGLQNGDLMRTINGYEMSSPDTALEAYSKLRSASNLSIAVTRRGRAMNLEYEIQ
ncbi:MAG: hypothetical protein OXT09_07685 [Myxococcales bacterium]|nr:hypothetical protein [Myxococcales bacterium]